MAKDKCILCGQDSPYEFETHIDFRVGYIEGAGQLCLECYNGGTDRNHIAVPERLIYDTPNDFDLGAKVRKMYYDSKNIR